MNETYKKFASLSTYELIRRIAEHSDINARNHLMEFRQIIPHGEIWILIHEYILYLCHNEIPFDPNRSKYVDREEFEQLINDLTRARFIEFPEENSEGEGCLKQYQYILKVVRESDDPDNSIKIEQLISAELKKTIRRHFYYCIKEGNNEINPFHTGSETD